MRIPDIAMEFMRRGEVSGLVVPSAMLQLAFGALFAVSFFGP